MTAHPAIVLDIAADGRNLVALLLVLPLAYRGLLALFRGDRPPPLHDDLCKPGQVSARRDALAPRSYLPVAS